LISVDTLRADHLPAYGYGKIETPAIDALRRDGIAYTEAYAQVPLTLPSHVSLLTGLLPPRSGVRDNLGYRLDRALHPTLPGLLKARGYQTGGAVSAYVLRGATGLGPAFDRYEDVTDPLLGGISASGIRRPGRQTLARALALLDGLSQGPFFLFVHFYEPHAPAEAEESFRSRYPLPYDAAVATADQLVGELVSALKSRKLYDGSLVVFLSDHGEGLSDHGEAEHGLLLYREALRVPLLVKLPGGSRAGTEVTNPVALVDLLPTAAEVLGFEAPAGLPGHSLLKTRPAGGIYSETHYPEIHLGWSALHSLVEGRFHLIEGPAPELFNWEADPAEAKNLFPAAPAPAMGRALGAMTRPLEAPRVGPDEAEALRSLGYLAGGSHREGPAKNPRDGVREYEALGEALRLGREGRAEEAVGALRALLATDPLLFDAQWELGAQLTHLGRYAEAADAFSRAGAMAPSMAAVVALSRAQVEIALGHLDTADTLARQGLEADPNRAHEILARVALLRPDPAAAEREANLIQGGPGDLVTRELLIAQVRAAQDRSAEQLQILDSLKARLEGRPVPDLEFFRGDALLKLKRDHEAETAFREETRQFPRRLEAYARLAIALALQGRPRTEVQEALKAMYRAKPGPESAGIAARTLALLGDGETARAWQRAGRPPS
jgi:tetratricopeptide (TPR) repeat protein